MTREWYTTCKDCGEEFGYSDDSYLLGVRRGLSRPERCPNCRKLHSREISTLGLSHFELTPIMPIPPSGIRAGRLGGMVHPTRIHKPKESKPNYDFGKFGIKDIHIHEYFEILQKKQVTVIVAPTGAGKSTFLPYRLMVPPKPFQSDLFSRNGQIIITQPRIQATRSIPLFVARDLNGSNLGAGFDVGFKHSGNPSTDWRNKMVYMTDGTLINMILRNELGRLSVIMIDEAHERSLNIDLILGLLMEQLGRYPNLKLIIASATINAGMFLEYFGGPNKFNPDDFAAVSEEGFLNYNNKNIARELKDFPVGFYGFPGKRQYSVESRFYEGSPIPENQWSGRMADEVAKKVLQILQDMQAGREKIRGDILGFLHGEAPIDRAVELIRTGVEEDPSLAGKVDVLPLYAKLPQTQQDAALHPKQTKQRLRVIISTNVAETSLTVNGIVHVVDSGLINESQWDSKTQTSFVLPKIHSQAGCKQRWGRAGRIQPGVAHCLYTKEQFENFPKYTDPEILRAPLDQIVLTAKTAGVDDISKFKWIQSPPTVELERAPQYLKQIGAIDDDGDLTDHGLELRGFGEEIDIANLMILADRFGCVVEMATLIPMRKLRGFTSILLWDKGWDAGTKRAVHKIHQGLLGPCQDDIEFSLKLWQAWDGLAFGRATNEQRKSWSQQFFVDHQVFRDQIAVERKNLLSSLSGHKKEETYRPIDFDLLTRLRILMACGLPNQIYLLDGDLKNRVELDQAPVYKPYIPEIANKRELELLHQDATIEISPESICANQAIEGFVCGKRQRNRLRKSPLAEPTTIITAGFITLLKPEWLDYVNQPVMNLARKIASETRGRDGKLLNTTTQFRLFIDQKFPIGTTVQCNQSKPAGKIVVESIESPASRVMPRRSNEDIEAPVDFEVLEREQKALDPSIQERDSKFIVEVKDDELDHANWPEQFDEELSETKDLLLAVDLGKLDGPQIEGQFIQTNKQPAKTRFSATVVGYDLLSKTLPVLQLAIPQRPSAFERFCDLYKVGDRISGYVVAIEQYVNDRLVYLVVQEEKSGLDVILDPYDASIGGRNFIIEQLHIGDPIEASIEAMERQGQRIRVTRLKKAEAEFLQFIQKGDERVLKAQIVEVRDNGLYIWLDPENTKGKIPVSSFAYIERLPKRPDEMSLGEFCEVRVNPRYKKTIRRTIGGLSEPELKRLQKYGWSSELKFDEQTGVLTANKRITYRERMDLLSLSPNPEFQKAVNILFRRTNELETRIIDIAGEKSLAQNQEQQKAGKWRIVRVFKDGLIVENEDGYEAYVSKLSAVFDPKTDLEQKFVKGKLVKGSVEEVDLENHKVIVSLLQTDKDPLRKYRLNQIVKGEVTQFTKDGSHAVVRIVPGVEGTIYKDDIAFESLASVKQGLLKSQKIKARITELNIQKRKIRLSIFGLVEKTMQVPLTHIGLIKGREGSTIKGIEGESQTRIHFIHEDQCSISGLSIKNVRLAIRLIEKILDIQIIKFKVSELQARKLVGKGGENINRIQKETGARIQINSSSKEVTVSAPDGLLLKKCLAKIKENILDYRMQVRIPSEFLGLIIGKGGSTVSRIQTLTNTRIDIARDQPGLIMIEGKNKASVSLAVGSIQGLVGNNMELISADEGKFVFLSNSLDSAPTPRKAGSKQVTGKSKTTKTKAVKRKVKITKVEMTKTKMTKPKPVLKKLKAKKVGSARVKPVVKKSVRVKSSGKKLTAKKTRPVSKKPQVSSRSGKR